MEYQPNEEANRRGLSVGFSVRIRGYDKPGVIEGWSIKGDPIIHFAHDENKLKFTFVSSKVFVIESAESAVKFQPNQETKDCGITLDQRVRTIEGGYIFTVVGWSNRGWPEIQHELSNKIEWNRPEQLILVKVPVPKFTVTDMAGNNIDLDRSLNKKKEEKKMAPIATTPKKAKRSTMVPAKEQKDNILSAVGKGLKLASANQAGEVILSLGEKLLGASAPAFLQDENGREVVKLLTAVLIATTVRTAPEFMENSDNIAKVCELQITHSTDMLSTRLMSTSREQLQQLASLGIDIARSSR